MISRRYFYNIKITISGGNGDYSYQHGIATRKTWFDESIEVLEEIVETFKDRHSEKVGNFEVISFNRIN